MTDFSQKSASELIAMMWTHADKPERVSAYLKIAQTVQFTDGKQFWEEFWSIWSSSENLNEDMKKISELVQIGQALGSPWLGLDDEEVAFLESAPEILTVYRGGNDLNQNGWSWTLSLDTARFFADRSVGSIQRIIRQAKVKKTDVLGYLSGRNEKEIIIRPENIFDESMVSSWEIEETSYNKFYYEIQSGKFYDNSELQLAHAQLIVDSLPNSDHARYIKEFRTAVEFMRWAKIPTRKIGVALELLEKLEK